MVGRSTHGGRHRRVGSEGQARQHSSPAWVYAKVLPINPRQPRRKIAGIPTGPLGLNLATQTLLHIGQRIVVGLEDFPKQGDIGNGEPKRVNLTQPLLIGKRGYVSSQLVKG